MDIDNLGDDKVVTAAQPPGGLTGEQDASAALPNVNYRDGESEGRKANILEKHTIGLPSVTAQSAALIAPAGAAVASMAFIASFAGGASPLAFLIGFVICIFLARVIGEYAKHLPSAGAFYTYLTRTFGSKVGFLAGVLQFGTYLMFVLFQVDFFGSFVSSLFPSVPWEIFSFALIAFATTFVVLGIRPSLRLGLIGLCFEIAVFMCFAVIVVVHGGAHGNTIQVFNPSSSLTGSSGIFTAVVFTLFAFAGFESATTLGDEARDRRRTIPRAIMLTTFGIGLFYIFISYAITIGYGNTPSGIKSFVAAPSPFAAIADRFGNGVLSGFMNLAVISSLAALNIVTMLAISRILWKMGHDHLLPHKFATLNRFKSPGVASLFAGGLMCAVALIGGGLWGEYAFSSWMSYFGTLFMIIAYSLVALGLPFFIWRNHRSEFKWLTHGLFPLISLAAMVWVFKGNVIPYPPSPLRWFIYATFGTVVVTIGIAFWLARHSPGTMLDAGAILGEADEEPVGEVRL
jgi:amino acid transporter